MSVITDLLSGYWIWLHTVSFNSTVDCFHQLEVHVYLLADNWITYDPWSALRLVRLFRGYGWQFHAEEWRIKTCIVPGRLNRVCLFDEFCFTRTVSCFRFDVLDVSTRRRSKSYPWKLTCRFSSYDVLFSRLVTQTRIMSIRINFILNFARIYVSAVSRTRWMSFPWFTSVNS